MTRDATSYPIVVAVDLTEMTDVVLAAALEVARGRGGAVIHALCVIDDSQDVLGRSIDHKKELAELEAAVRARVMGSLSSQIEGAGQGPAVEVHARAGRPAEQILKLASDKRADLIVLGRHSQTRVRPLFLGSVPSRLLGQAPCNILVVQPKAYGEE